MIDFVHPPHPEIRDREEILCKAIMHGTIDEIHHAVSAYISIRDFYEKKLAAANALADLVDTALNSKGLYDGELSRQLDEALGELAKTADRAGGTLTFERKL
jgi:hypothetical protein